MIIALLGFSETSKSSLGQKNYNQQTMYITSSEYNKAYGSVSGIMPALLMTKMDLRRKHQEGKERGGKRLNPPVGDRI